MTENSSVWPFLQLDIQLDNFRWNAKTPFRCKDILDIFLFPSVRPTFLWRDYTVSRVIACPQREGGNAHTEPIPD